GSHCKNDVAEALADSIPHFDGRESSEGKAFRLNLGEHRWIVFPASREPHGRNDGRRRQLSGPSDAQLPKGTSGPRSQMKDDARRKRAAVDLDRPFDLGGRVTSLAEKLLEGLLVALVLDLVDALSFPELNDLGEALPNLDLQFVRSSDLDRSDPSRLAFFDGNQDRDLAGVGFGITLAESSRRPR